MIIIAIIEEDFVGHQISIVDNKEVHVSTRGVKEYPLCPVRLSKTLANKRWTTNNLAKLEKLLKGSIIKKEEQRII